MNLAEVISAVAALLTTAAFVPQAFRVLRTRETAAISLTMYALFTAGVALWLAYGIITVQWSITIANAITLALAALILAVKLRSLKRGPQS